MPYRSLSHAHSLLNPSHPLYPLFSSLPALPSFFLSPSLTFSAPPISPLPRTQDTLGPSLTRAYLCLQGWYRDTNLLTPPGEFNLCYKCPNHSTSAFNSIGIESCQCMYPFVGPAGGPCAIRTFQWELFTRFNADDVSDPNNVKVMPRPAGRFLPGMVAIGTGVWLYGGLGENNTMLSDVWRAETRGFLPEWHSFDQTGVFQGAVPGARYAHAMAAVMRENVLLAAGEIKGMSDLTAEYGGGYAVVFGGNLSGRVGDDLWIMGMDNGTIAWGQVLNLDGDVPLAREWASMVSVKSTDDNDGTIIYMHGGRTASGRASADMYSLVVRFQTLDNSVGAWTLISQEKLANGTIPPARYAHGFAASRGRLYVYGGIDQHGRVLSDLHMYVPPKGTLAQIRGGRGSMWVNLGGADGLWGRLPLPRYGHAMVGFTAGTFYKRDKILIFGGRADSWNASYDEVNATEATATAARHEEVSYQYYSDAVNYIFAPNNRSKAGGVTYLRDVWEIDVQDVMDMFNATKIALLNAPPATNTNANMTTLAAVVNGTANSSNSSHGANVSSLPANTTNLTSLNATVHNATAARTWLFIRWADLSETPSPPSPRFGTGFAGMHNNMLWLFGGNVAAGGGRISTELWRFDTNATNRRCAPGFFNIEAQCYACPAGYYMNGTVPVGQLIPRSLCVPCPGNSTSEVASMYLESCKCVPGYTGNTVNGTCTPVSICVCRACKLVWSRPCLCCSFVIKSTCLSA
jgi:hypothetical protein